MAVRQFQGPVALALLLLSGCAKKQAQAPPPPPPPPPPPKQSLVVLLPNPDGKAGGVVLTNSAGSETLSQPYQATRVERSDTAPSAPFTIDQAEVRRVFGAVLDALPAPEVVFMLHFAGDSDTLLPESLAQIPSILDTIRQRNSTSISVIGHTDTTSTPEYNSRLGLRRAQSVATILRVRGVNDANIFTESHGEADLAVRTGRGVAEPRNRRVEVTVR